MKVWNAWTDEWTCKWMPWMNKREDGRGETRLGGNVSKGWGRKRTVWWGWHVKRIQRVGKQCSHDHFPLFLCSRTDHINIPSHTYGRGLTALTFIAVSWTHTTFVPLQSRFRSVNFHATLPCTSILVHTVHCLASSRIRPRVAVCGSIVVVC